MTSVKNLNSGPFFQASEGGRKEGRGGVRGSGWEQEGEGLARAVGGEGVGHNLPTETTQTIQTTLVTQPYPDHGLGRIREATRTTRTMVWVDFGNLPGPWSG